MQKIDNSKKQQIYIDNTTWKILKEIATKKGIKRQQLIREILDNETDTYIKDKHYLEKSKVVKYLAYGFPIAGNKIVVKTPNKKDIIFELKEVKNEK